MATYCLFEGDGLFANGYKQKSSNMLLRISQDTQEIVQMLLAQVAIVENLSEATPRD